MIEFNKKKNNNFLYSPFILFVLFCFLILFIYNMVGLVKKERETTKKRDLMLSNIETLRNREKVLNSEIEKLKTEEGVEEIIRDKYQVVKEGEKMVVIVDENKEVITLVEKDMKHGFVNWFKSFFKQ